MEGYRGKHTSSQPWAVASTASVRGRGRHERKNRRRRRWAVVILVVVLAALAWPFVETRLVATDRVFLQSESLPADIGHLRIVYLTDLHLGSAFGDAQVNGLISRVNKLKPDIVLFGGDYGVDNAAAVRFFRKMPAIHARYAILGVLGEADRGETPLDLSTLQDAMRSAGVTPLVNEVSRVRVGSSSVYVAGLDDPASGSPDLKGLASRVSASDYVIFLCHSPSVISDAQSVADRDGHLGWFDLGLFGHTHGGQLGPFSSLLHLTDDIPARYHGGWLTENRVDLLVSRGVGTTGFPVRLFCPPQIHDIDISLK